jgi:hypothetical protein
MTLLLAGAPGAIRLIPFKIPDTWNIILPKMAHQPFAKAIRSHAPDKQDILILIAKHVHAIDGRHTMQIATVPPFRLFDSRDHTASPRHQYVAVSQNSYHTILILKAGGYLT